MSGLRQALRAAALVWVCVLTVSTATAAEQAVLAGGLAGVAASADVRYVAQWVAESRETIKKRGVFFVWLSSGDRLLPNTISVACTRKGAAVRLISGGQHGGTGLRQDRDLPRPSIRWA